MSLPVRLLKTSTGVVKLTGSPTVASAAPSVPQNFQATASGSRLTLSCDPPADRNGSPVWRYVWTITDPNSVTTTQITGPGQRSAEFDGLPLSTTYTVSVVAVNAKGTSASASSSASTGASDVFDPRDESWFASNTGPTAATTPFTAKTGVKLEIAAGSGNIQGPFTALQFAYPDNHYIVTQSANGAMLTMTDCDVQLAIRESGSYGTYTRCHFEPNIGSQLALGASSGAINGPADLTNCLVEAAVDCYQGAGAPMSASRQALIQKTWFICAGSAPESRPAATDANGNVIVPAVPGTYRSTWLSKAELALVNNSPTQGMTLQPGQFIRVMNTAANLLMDYECVGAGTLDMSNTSTWPTKAWDSLKAGDVTQPFAGGTCQLICMGPSSHADGLQWSSGGRCEISQCWVQNPSNSPLFVQSTGNGASGVPCMGIYAHDCRFDGGFNKWISVGTTGFDPVHGKYVYAGGLTQDGSGNWIDNAVNRGKARPWGIRLEDNWIGPLRKGAYNSGAYAVVTDCSGSAPKDHVPMVQTPGEWYQAVAAQFGWDSGDARLPLALNGFLDWTQQSYTINQAVCNARYGGGSAPPFGGAVDARGWIVWNNNRRMDTADQILPGFYAGYPGFDPVTGYRTLLGTN